MWEKEPNISFWDALNTVYLNYGPTGFRKLMFEKEQEVAKSAQKGFKHLLFSFFYWPNIFFVFLMVLFFIFIYKTFAQFNPNIASLIIVSCVEGIILFDIFISIYSYKKRKKMREPLLILQEPSSFTLSILFQYSVVSFIIDFHSDKSNIVAELSNPKIFFIYAFTILLYLILALARWQYIKGMFKKAKALYPTAF
jgi:hypothetical protein